MVNVKVDVESSNQAADEADIVWTAVLMQNNEEYTKDEDRVNWAATKFQEEVLTELVPWSVVVPTIKLKFPDDSANKTSWLRLLSCLEKIVPELDPAFIHAYIVKIGAKVIEFATIVI